MDSIYSFDFPFSPRPNCSDASPNTSSRLFGHVYEFDLTLPKSQSSDDSFLSQLSDNLDFHAVAAQETHALATPISPGAFSALGKTKSVQKEDILPQLPVPIYSAHLTPSVDRKSSRSPLQPVTSTNDEPLPEAGRRRAVSFDSNPAIDSECHSSSLRDSVHALPTGILDGYNSLRFIFSTPSKPAASQRIRMSTPSLDYSSSRSSSSPSGSALPTSPPNRNVDIHNFQPSELNESSCYATVPSQPDMSPVIHQFSSPHSAKSSFRLRPADFSEVVLLEDYPLPLDKEKNSAAEAVCKHVDSLFSPFMLRTPEKYPTTADAVAHTSSPLTPVTDDESIADPSSMKDALPQNPPSSLAIHTARKRPYSDLVNSPSPSFPPKRARSNLLLALKEREKLAKKDESDSFSSLEKSPAERLNQPSATATAGPSKVNAARHQTASTSSSSTEPSLVFTQRTFPREIVLDGKTTALEMSDDVFPLFYRRFPASSYFKAQDSTSECAMFKKTHPGGIYNPPRSAFDLYTPRFVKGKGKDKMGLCPICIEDIKRGGEGKKVWLAMKFSAYKCYHLQYSHGISASSSLPFSPPLAFRMATRSSNHKSEKTIIQEGKCHRCTKWIPVEGIKDVEVKVKELFWWKHAAACHACTTIEGEADVFEEDEVYSKLKALGPAAETFTRKR